MSAAIELNAVSKHFGPKRAVDNVSFVVREGECYGLIGPNGAGKTTTFSMMCGFLFPTAGQWTMGVRDLACSVTTVDGTDLVGSVAGSGR